MIMLKCRCIKCFCRVVLHIVDKFLYKINSELSDYAETLMQTLVQMYSQASADLKVIKIREAAHVPPPVWQDLERTSKEEAVREYESIKKEQNCVQFGKVDKNSFFGFGDFVPIPNKEV